MASTCEDLGTGSVRGSCVHGLMMKSRTGQKGGVWLYGSTSLSFPSLVSTAIITLAFEISINLDSRAIG